MTVVFTGDDLKHPRDDLKLHAKLLGLVIGTSVTKSTDLPGALDDVSAAGLDM